MVNDRDRSYTARFPPKDPCRASRIPVHWKSGPYPESVEAPELCTDLATPGLLVWALFGSALVSFGMRTAFSETAALWSVPGMHAGADLWRFFSDLGLVPLAALLACSCGASSMRRSARCPWPSRWATCYYNCSRGAELRRAARMFGDLALRTLTIAAGTRGSLLPCSGSLQASRKEIRDGTTNRSLTAQTNCGTPTSIVPGCTQPPPCAGRLGPSRGASPDHRAGAVAQPRSARPPRVRVRSRSP